MKVTPEEIISDYEQTLSILSSPEIQNHKSKFKEASIKQGKLYDAFQLAKDISRLKADITEAEQMLKEQNDAEVIEFLNNSITQDNASLNKLNISFANLTSESSIDDSRNAILEIRAGTGGNEAGLFAHDLYRMYVKYAESNGWIVQQLSQSQSEINAIKEVIFLVSGKNVYGKLKYESGVHRVQRVPTTESAGRIHTSAASVVVLPEVEDVEITVKDEDLRIDVFRAGGPGGQSVNTTDSAVRITHIPTNIVVSCQDEKSQLKNKIQALKVLKSRLYEQQRLEKESKLSEQRKSSMQSGDRSAKIRTYNFAQNRITDHRIKKSWYNLPEILSGNLEEILVSTKEILTTE